MLAIQISIFSIAPKLVIDEYLNIVIAQLIEGWFWMTVPDVCDESASRKGVFTFSCMEDFESRPKRT